MTQLGDGRGSGPAAKQRHKLGLDRMYAAFESTGSGWVDAIDPDLPAEAELKPGPTPRNAAKRNANGKRRLDSHKLILLGVGFGGGALALGYWGAAWALR